MKNRVSEKSRRFSLLALDELEKIGKKYTILPEIGLMSDEEISWLNEKIRTFHENVAKTSYKKFSFLNESRKIRNQLAHATGETSKEEFLDSWRIFFDFYATAKSELEENIRQTNSERKKIRKFEKFGSEKFGNEFERKRLVQSIFDEMDSFSEKNDKLNFSDDEISNEAKKYLQPKDERQKVLFDFAREHDELSSQIQEEILGNLQKAYDETDISKPSNPFYEENVLLDSLDNISGQHLLENISEFQNKLCTTKSGKDNSADFDFYKNQYESIFSKKNSDTENEIEILSRNLKADLKNSLFERFTSYQISQIDEMRKAFLEELYKKIEKFMRLEKLLSPFIKDLGRLWDLSHKAFETSGFEILEQFAKLLEQDESLQELAKMIGKQSRTQEIFEKEMRDKIVIKTEWHPKPAYRGEISGLRYSSDIASVLPAELAMMKNPAAKKLFQLKFAQKQLLSFDYQNDKAESKEEHESEEVDVAKKDQKGPVIICVDTSGSMSGTPENIAKTVTFALSKIAMEEERKCYLISFSTGIETLDMSDFKSGDALTRIVQFLRMSFNGGTDASPALRHAVQMLQKDGYKNADVLMISDFVMGTLPDDLVKSIEEEKKKNTDFYSLVIGSSGNQSTIACFNHNWLYDTSDSRAQRHLVEHLQTMRTRT